jgi:hypothetical protein
MGISQRTLACADPAHGKAKARAYVAIWAMGRTPVAIIMHDLWIANLTGALRKT